MTPSIPTAPRASPRRIGAIALTLLALTALPALAQHGRERDGRGEGNRGGGEFRGGEGRRDFDRPGNRGYGGPAYAPRGYGGPGWRGGEYWRGHEGGRGYGAPVIAAPLLGLGLGALLGGALLAPQPQYVTPPGVYYPPGKPDGYGAPPPAYYGY